MVKYTLYLDVWLLRLGCNFIFEYLLLWAAASISQTKTKPLRICLGALVGTLHYFLYLLASFSLVPFYGLLRFLPIVVLTSIAMILVTFYPRSWRHLLSIAGYFYIIGFISAGIGMAAAYTLGSHGSPQFTAGTLFSVLTILLIAELGWGVVQQTIINRVYRVPIEIVCDNTTVHMSALVDTGNQLKDPLTLQSVVVVDKNALIDLLPTELIEIIIALAEGEQSAIERLGSINKWQTRLRLIPFSSIGKTNGMLIGFRPDQLKIDTIALPRQLQPTIAIHPYSLDPNGEYMALIPPILVKNSLTMKGEEVRAKETTSADI